MKWIINCLFCRYFFLVLLALILLGLFNGLVFLPVLLVIVGPPAHVIPSDHQDCLPPCTPEPSPVRFKAKPPKVKSSSRSDRNDHGFSSHKPRRHNSDISLSTIAEETHSHASSESVSSYDEREQDAGSVQSSYNGTSVFLEPHITVETSTVPANVSFIFSFATCLHDIQTRYNPAHNYLEQQTNLDIFRDQAADHPDAPLPVQEAKLQK